jgi:glycosyltransferase involved in cell wall biosynthesis
MLEPIQDNRSGNRLELVVFTFNEERHIRLILEYYASDYDVVLLDGGSSDRTVEIALAAQATVFRRIGAYVGESYFAHYANEVTRSGLCFLLLADEFIAKAELAAIETELRERASAVLCNKAEWFYGRRMLTFNHIEPRGFRKGCVKYIEHLHENLKIVESPDAPACQHLFTLAHAHIWSVRGHYGKIGLYTNIEIDEFHKSGHITWRFFRRYVASWIGFPLIKVWRERGIGVPRALFWFLADLAEIVIASLNWIEYRFLMSTEEQMAQYSRFFTDEGPMQISREEPR